jgi:hypothetical protein
MALHTPAIALTAPVESAPNALLLAALMASHLRFVVLATREPVSRVAVVP